jgi:uncharacterized protein YbaP (TraB family)
MELEPHHRKVRASGGRRIRRPPLLRVVCRGVVLLVAAQILGCVAASAPEGFFWQATKIGHSQVFLIPSLHAASDDLSVLPRRIENVIMLADFVLAERNSVLDSSTSRTNECGNSPVKAQQLTGKTLERVEKLIGIKIGKVSVLQARSMLEQATADSLRLSALKSIDFGVRRAAKNFGKKVVSLEDDCAVLHAIGVAMSMHDEPSLSFYIDAVSDGRVVNHWRGVEDGWKFGHQFRACAAVTALGRISSAEGKILDAAVTSRNAEMAATIEGHSRISSVVVVVGMAHLCGEGSLVDELGKRGFAVNLVAGKA